MSDDVSAKPVSDSTKHGLLARGIGAITFFVSVITVAVVADIFRSLGATPSELSSLDFTRPTLAVAITLIAVASLMFGVSSLAISWRGSTVHAVALFVAACVLLLAAWAMHQALWHLVRGMSHAGPYWFGRS